jgi:serine/threonine protein kinase
MISDRKEACLADFGLAIISSLSAFSTDRRETNARWLPKELFDDTEKQINSQTDIYAFGYTFLEVRSILMYCLSYLTFMHKVYAQNPLFITSQTARES